MLRESIQSGIGRPIEKIAIRQPQTQRITIQQQSAPHDIIYPIDFFIGLTPRLLVYFDTKAVIPMQQISLIIIGRHFIKGLYFTEARIISLPKISYLQRIMNFFIIDSCHCSREISHSFPGRLFPKQTAAPTSPFRQIYIDIHHLARNDKKAQRAVV